MAAITADTVRTLRQRTGAGMMECKTALEKCRGDVFLASGYLKYQGCAVCVKEAGFSDAEAYERWVWRNARRHAEELHRAQD